MKKETKTIRLIYPQWQGANIVKLITEVENPHDASRGYFLGAQLLNFLAPDNGQETLTVPVSTEITDRKVTDGVLDRDIIVRQTRAALNMLQVSNPDKIVTLGGECSVSHAPRRHLSRISRHGRNCLHGIWRHQNSSGITHPIYPIKHITRGITQLGT